MDLYRISVDEYRFQVNLNWNRTQYYIVLNLGILGLATGLFKVNGGDEAPVITYGLYFAGALCCVLALFAGQVQRAYYRQTKDHKARLESLLGLGALAIRTTPGMGGTVRRVAKVTTFHTVILSVVLALDLVGFAYAVSHHDDKHAPPCSFPRHGHPFLRPGCHGWKETSGVHPQPRPTGCAGSC